MKPHCPNCLKEMTKASASRNLFNCEPCREIIQYLRRQRGSRRARPAILLADPPQALRPHRSRGLISPAPHDAGVRFSPASAAIRGGRTTVTVQAASEATLAETLPSSVRRNELCRAPMMTWST